MTDVTEGPEPLTPEEFVSALLSIVEKKELADGVDA
jgi:hypothetical protein